MPMKQILMLLFITFNAIVSAATYYVSPSGNNSNAGTLNSPFKTINYGISKLIAGDILYVRNGIYYERVTVYGHDGVKSNPVIISAYPGESPIIDGTGITNSSLIYIPSNYVHLVGFEIRNIDLTDKDGGCTGVIVNGTNCIISRCTVHDSWGSGIGLGGNYSIVEYCSIYNCCLNNNRDEGRIATSWGSGISARRYPNYCVIRHCKVHDIWGEGISTFEATHTTIEDNVIYDVCSAMLYVSDSRDCVVQRNLVYTTRDMAGSQVGLAYWNEKALTENVYNLRNVLINNIVFGCHKNFRSGNSTVIDAGTLIANNTFVNSVENYCVEIGIATHTGGLFANNIVIQENGLPCIYAGDNHSLTYSHNLYNKPYNISALGSGDIIADARLSKTGEIGSDKLTAEYFELLSNSPAINKGTVFTQISDDIFGNKRDTSPDIGAHEYYPVDPSIKVNNITITGAASAKTITTDNGTLQLTAAVLPSNATNKSVTWSLTNGTGRAIISSSGLVTAVASGIVTAKATANDGSGVYGTLVITISNQVIQVTSITITGAGGATTIAADGGTLQLGASVLPSNAANKTVTWSITNGSSLASINSTTGLVTATDNGSITVRATAGDGSGVYGTLTITITNQVIPVTGITVMGAGGATTITTDGGTLQLSATVLPANADNKTVTWSITSGSGFASVNSSTGLLTATDNGSVTARATANDGSGVYGTLTITISNQVIPVTSITVTGAGGATTIAADDGTLQLSATVLPSNAANKTVTWSITSGSSRASINATTGLVTATDNGSITVRATAR